MLSTSLTARPYSSNALHTPSITCNRENVSPLPSASLATSSVTLAEPTNNEENSTFPSSPAIPQRSSPDNSPPNVRKKKRATSKNPIYGQVAGVMRGTSSSHGNVTFIRETETESIVGLEIHRTHQIPVPIEKTSSASKAFLESLNSIFIKARA